MRRFLILFFIVSMAVASASACCLVCPQCVQDDPSPQFCATNKYGSYNVTYSQMTNWNCNYPLNLYKKVSDKPCAPGPDTLTPCGKYDCPSTVDPVCASLPSSNDILGAFQTTVSVFQNQCQLDYYNCRNPQRRYVANGIMPSLCVSVTF